MKTIFEHTFDETLLSDGGYVLDAGCGVDFWFSSYMTEIGMKVISLDPNPKIIKIPDGVIYENSALVAFASDMCIMKTYLDTDAATIVDCSLDTMKNKVISSTNVNAITIAQIMDRYGVEKFDLIKMDIEGSEYDILMNIDDINCSQISIEFHDFRNINPYYPNNEKYYEALKEKLKDKYEFIDDLSPRPKWMDKRYYHWDVLLREK